MTERKVDEGDERTLQTISTRVSPETYKWLQGEQAKHFIETGSRLKLSAVVRMLLERMQRGESTRRRA